MTLYYPSYHSFIYIHNVLHNTFIYASFRSFSPSSHISDLNKSVSPSKIEVVIKRDLWGQIAPPRKEGKKVCYGWKEEGTGTEAYVGEGQGEWGQVRQ